MVINVAPDGLPLTIPAGQVTGKLQVYNTGNPPINNETTDYNYQIGANPVQNASLPPGNTQSYMVNQAQFQIENYGPSVLQLLYQ